MSKPQNDCLLQIETTCGALLHELEIIWDEIGQSETEKEKMLFEIKQECLEVYSRQVDQANQSRAQLRQEIADSEAEIAAICSAMGERPVHIRESDKNVGSLKEDLRKIIPELEEMRKRRSDRENQFKEVQEQILGISDELYGPKEYAKTDVDESDLTLTKLEELHRQLQTLQKEKSDRLKKIQDQLLTLDSLCSVLGLDFNQIVCDIHPSLVDSLGSKIVNNYTIQQLTAAVQKTREVKLQRMQKLQDLATTMLELWNLMDTPIEEQQKFQCVTCNIAASEHEITEPNALSVDFIDYVEAEVNRLEELKSSKMKELVLRKRTELEEICRKTHLVPELDSAVEDLIEAIEAGSVDPACVLEQIELQIAKVKEETFSRKEILEKVEKWLAACDEENWLEEYNRDENRYNLGRGTHLTLKRAEKARALVNKMPAKVDALASITIAWEKDKGIDFKYDGISLLSMLEEYKTSRQEKEQERRRQRDMKRLQGQLVAEQEVRYGSKPTPSKSSSFKKTSKMSSFKKVPQGGSMLQTPKPDQKGTQPSTTRKTDKAHQSDEFNHLDDGTSSFSSARGGFGIAGVPVKKHSFCDREIEESPLMRQPFSPISSTVSSRENMANNTADEANRQSEKLKKTFALKNVSFITPSKAAASTEENRSPKVMSIPVPTTSSVVSVPMNMTMTPAPPLSVPFRSNSVVQEIEYSFEERRAGFLLC